MVTVAFAWLVVGLLGSVPFWVVAIIAHDGTEVAKAYASPIGAIFEGFSGFTSCGLTMSGRPDLLPISLQWWRSLLEWVGGVGVVVLALALTDTDSDPDELFEAEARSTPHQDIRCVAIRIWKVYVAYTALVVLALWTTGMRPWEAVNHGLTAISTGGFAITPSGFGGYGLAPLIVTIVAMVLGATSFNLHATLWLDRDRRAWTRNTQLRWLGGGLISGALLLFAVSRAGGDAGSGVHVVFQWVSALCTCGFSAIDLSRWSAAALLLLMVAMTVGGAAGSTAGGLKLSRIAWIAKGIVRRVVETINGKPSLRPYAEDGNVIDVTRGRRQIRRAGSMLALWICTLAVGSLLLMILLPEQNPHHVVFEAVSATGGVGLSTGVTRASLPPAAKLILVALMWMGRLEIVAILALVCQPLHRPLRS